MTNKVRRGFDVFPPDLDMVILPWTVRIKTLIILEKVFTNYIRNIIRHDNSCSTLILIDKAEDFRRNHNFAKLSPSRLTTG